MTTHQSLEYVEIDVDYCSLTYGGAPCTATLAERVTNGTFTSDITSWAAGVGTLTAAYDAGTLKLTHSSTNLATYQQGVVTTVGQEYTVSIDVTANDGTASAIKSDSSSDVTTEAVDILSTVTTGTFTTTFTATATTSYIHLRVDSTGGSIRNFDNVSVTSVTQKKCFNTINTCQDRPNFANVPVTLRFATDTGFNPADIEAIPSITGISISPSVISLGSDLGVRSSVTITFKDHRHSDTGDGGDKYLADRSYDPYETGTYWAKFRQRQLYLRGRPLRLIRGKVGQTIGAMETRNYVVDSFTGPSSNGTFKIIAKDVLKLADNDRTVAPAPSGGALNGALTIGGGSFTLTPAGVGATDYAASGYVAIGGKEICTYTRSGDVMTLTARGVLNTEAQAHNTSSRAQEVLVYAGVKPSVIIEDLLTTYAGVSASYISTATWAAEDDAYLQQIYTAYIAEPTGVNKLISELIEQAALALWWDDVAQELKFQVLRDVPKQAGVYDNSVMAQGTVSIEDQPNKRISQAWVYYAQRNPLRPLTDLDNYKALYVNTNAQNETDFGSASIKKIYSRWIPEFGSAIANRVSDIILARFSNAPRKISFDLFKAEGLVLPGLGGAHNLAHTFLQTDEGEADSVPVQITSIQPGKTAVRVTSEELSFGGVELDDPNDHTITIDTDTLNFNLRTIHDTLYPVVTVAGSIVVTCNIAAGVIVGSSSTATAAFDVGSWIDLPAIVINVVGRIQGAGGKGGRTSDRTSRPVTAGRPGGTALLTTVACELVNTGEIYGGGGGGDAILQGPPPGGSGIGAMYAGGGGSGSVPGVGGYSPFGSADSGTTELGGSGRGATNDGGNFGTAGHGWVALDGAGGAAGNAIDGISHVTDTTPGTRAGPEIN